MSLCLKTFRTASPEFQILICMPLHMLRFFHQAFSQTFVLQLLLLALIPQQMFFYLFQVSFTIFPFLFLFYLQRQRIPLNYHHQKLPLFLKQTWWLILLVLMEIFKVNQKNHLLFEYLCSALELLQQCFFVFQLMVILHLQALQLFDFINLD